MVYFWKIHWLGSYKRNSKMALCVSFVGKSIKAQKSARYLGIMVDDKLNGMAHCVYVKQSLANYVRTHSLSRRHWGLSGEVLKRLYKGGIERSATYGCSFWWTGTGCMRDKSGLITETSSPCNYQVLLYNQYGGGLGTSRDSTARSES